MSYNNNTNMYSKLSAVLSASLYERNKLGRCKKLITLSADSVRRLTEASDKYGISASYIIDLLIQKAL